ncbi:hypothetical protein K3495_g11431 [Podosphaera aphanis]|nr:hypothetical protein K3495_g11431 [Podosphaera aphanis]
MLKDDVEEDSDIEPEGIVIAASSRINNTLTLYDTGASHHFVPHSSLFCDVNQCSKPFKFDQDVGTQELSQQGTATLKIGNLTLKLRETFLSPESSCNIVSAGGLERICNIQLQD